MLHLWLVHRRESFVRKFFWSFVLLFPLLGWLFYAGCFQIPDVTDTPCGESGGGE
jgi:hypothetical protein